MSQLEHALAEINFDEDLPASTLENILALFPTPETAMDHFVTVRERMGITDVKRGELYPEVIGGGTRLQRTIARVYGVDEIQAQPNFGCSGCIDTFLTAVKHLELAGHRRSGLLVATPTYFRYYYKVKSLGMEFLGVPFGPNYEYPVEQILEVIREKRPSALFLTTPNNPTGVPISDRALTYVLDNIPEDIYVGIDRTCANVNSEITTSLLVRKYFHKRIAVFHSFSKYCGMSHLRIGFCLISHRGLAAELDRYRPFGLNLESVLRASYILATQGELCASKDVLKNIKDNKSTLNDFLLEHEQYSCTNFASNYALLLLPRYISARTLCSKLASKKIYVMPGYELPELDEGYIRIHTAGRPIFMERLIEALKNFDKQLQK